jgi:hypothetical protein
MPKTKNQISNPTSPFSACVEWRKEDSGSRASGWHEAISSYG